MNLLAYIFAHRANEMRAAIGENVEDWTGERVGSESRVTWNDSPSRFLLFRLTTQTSRSRHRTFAHFCTQQPYQVIAVDRHWARLR